jgi:23S rRNA (adenine2503-C2)-methyltransferase
MVALGQPGYRARQAHASLHQLGVWDSEGMTELPKLLRGELERMRPLRSLTPEIDLISSIDGTNKVLFRAADGAHIESVLMTGGPAERRRYTVCVSSQVGCPAACTFCASGLSFTRNLDTAEIVDQVEFFAGRLRHRDERLDNVVYMGMGEPFLNYGRVMESIARLRDPEGLGIGARRITVSTVGVVPVIERFAREAGEVNLAVSLHAPTDELRTRLVPYNQRFPIGDIMRAVRQYVDSTRRRVSFEYVLLEGTNDGLALASELARLLVPLRPLVHVNLIPWNPFPEAGFGRATRAAAEGFAERVRRGGINTTVRYSKGLDINAACGQLRNVAVNEALAS